METTLWPPSLLSQTNGWSFARVETTDQASSQDLIADQQYLSLRLLSIQCKHTSSRKEFGFVSAVKLPKLGTNGEGRYFSRSNWISESSFSSLEDQLLLEHMPYRGGRIGIDFALFSTALGNTSFPSQIFKAFLDHEARHSDGTGMAAAEIIHKASESPELVLEAGIRYKCCSPQTGCFLHTTLPYYALSFRSVLVNKETHQIHSPVDISESLCNLTLLLESHRTNPQWFKNPDLLCDYRTLESCRDSSEVVQKICKRMAACPGLLPQDGERLANLLIDLTQQIPPHAPLPPLDSIPLFESETSPAFC